MDSRELDAALLYLSYVIRRSGESAEEVRAEVGPVADAMEARYQSELQQARVKQQTTRTVH
jgi:hypothetical protein